MGVKPRPGDRKGARSARAQKGLILSYVGHRAQCQAAIPYRPEVLLAVFPARRILWAPQRQLCHTARKKKSEARPEAGWSPSRFLATLCGQCGLREGRNRTPVWQPALKQQAVGAALQHPAIDVSRCCQTQIGRHGRACVQGATVQACHSLCLSQDAGACERVDVLQWPALHRSHAARPARN